MRAEGRYHPRREHPAAAGPRRRAGGAPALVQFCALSEQLRELEKCSVPNSAPVQTTVGRIWAGSKLSQRCSGEQRASRLPSPPISPRVVPSKRSGAPRGPPRAGSTRKAHSGSPRSALVGAAPKARRDRGLARKPGLPRLVSVIEEFILWHEVTKRIFYEEN